MVINIDTYSFVLIIIAVIFLILVTLSTTLQILDYYLHGASSSLGLDSSEGTFTLVNREMR